MSSMFHGLKIKRIFNNYSPKTKLILSNNPRDEVAQVIIRLIKFSFVLFVSSSKTSRNRAVAIWKISASVL